ncbi:ferrous iron transport protein B [symbiont of Argiope bruennichi]|uniref:ferrous iron transport protein B n=1 Tax=symbiont of Argiope bruennichi TaxID=2810479 RepID=UPI003DA6BA5B
MNKDLINKKKIILLGNPNCGKSSLINAIVKKFVCMTGNWHGVTIGKKIVHSNFNNTNYEIIDTPGIYDFNPTSVDTKITCHTIEENKYDLIINVIDGSNLNKGLYLTQLLREINANFVIVVNHLDIIEKNFKDIDVKKLELFFQTKVLTVSALEEKNIDKFFPFVEKYFEEKEKTDQKKEFLFYDNHLSFAKNEIINDLKKQRILQAINQKEDEFTLNFYASRIMENNKHYFDHLKIEKFDKTKLNIIQKNFANETGNYLANYIFQKRVKFINNVFLNLKINKLVSKVTTTTIKIDKIVLNRFLALPILILTFSLMFILVFNIANPLKNIVDDLINGLLGGYLQTAIKNNFLERFIVEGVISGAGTVITFVPIIFVLYFFVAILQQTGYMARMAFILNELFKKVGLNGEAIFPLVLGIGCNVGSIYATRAIKDKKTRWITALVVPFIPCSARLAVFVLFASAFFYNSGAYFLLFLYFLGIFTTLLLAYIVNIIIRKKSRIFISSVDVNSLPNYVRPRIKNILTTSGIYAKGYLKKASGIILFSCIILWLLNEPVTSNNTSIIEEIAKGLKYIFYPLGFWNHLEFIIAIFPAIIAKETAIGALAVLYHLDEKKDVLNFSGFLHNSLDNIKNIFISLLPWHWLDGLLGTTNSTADSSLTEKLSHALITKPQAISYCVFLLLTIPCVTTLGAQKGEFGWKFMGLGLTLGLAVPYIASTFFYGISCLIFSESWVQQF